jgi:hypothetical protein
VSSKPRAGQFEDEVQARMDIFSLMHEAADRGMRGSAFNVEDGRANPIEVREMIVDRAHKVRNARLREYTIFAGAFGVIPLILGAVVLLTGAFDWLDRPAAGQPYDPLFVWIPFPKIPSGPRFAS